MLLPSYQLPPSKQTTLRFRRILPKYRVLLKHFDPRLCFTPIHMTAVAKQWTTPGLEPNPVKNAIQPSKQLIKGEERHESPGPQQIPRSKYPAWNHAPRETWSIYQYIFTTPHSPATARAPRPFTVPHFPSLDSTPPCAFRVLECPHVRMDSLGKPCDVLNTGGKRYTRNQAKTAHAYSSPLTRYKSDSAVEAMDGATAAAVSC